MNLYDNFDFLRVSEKLTENEKKLFSETTMEMSDEMAINLLNGLSRMLSKYYEKKVLIFLDEYDTPMQEAYVSGYWEEFTSFIRSMFNTTFKTNQYLDRAVLTGITRGSKQSIFSDLNNLEVVTTTSDKYATCFSLMEKEVFDAMEERGLSDKAGVKLWYDGFTFGSVTDIYDPWSIINFLSKKTLGAYWANTSSNSLVGKLIREGSTEIKLTFERLLRGEIITGPIDEQIVFDRLQGNASAIWSLLLATGYLKVISFETQGEATANRKPRYELKLTNQEVVSMFRNMITEWFDSVELQYNNFIKALLLDDVKMMNRYFNSVSREIFSYTHERNGLPFCS